MKLNNLTIFISIGILSSFSSCAAQEVSKKAVVEDSSLVDSSELFTDRDLLQVVDLNTATKLELKDDKKVDIKEEGSYLLTGQVENTMIIIDAGDNGKVQLILDNLSITNTNIPAIYVKSADKVFITTLNGVSSLAVSDKYLQNDEANLDAVIFSKSDLIINGVGSLDIVSTYGNGISSKDDLKVTGGILTIDAYSDGLEANDSIRIYEGEISITAGSDALHSENDDDPLLGYVYIQNGILNITAADDGIRGNSFVQIDGGIINIHTSQEGIEATHIQINSGIINIYATDDGINATAKTTMGVVIEVYGGDITVKMASGDTDAFDSNGDLFIYGGNITVEAQSSFDADGIAQLVDGNVTINGILVTELPENRQGRRRTK